MLATDLRDELLAHGERVFVATKADLDITDSRCIAECVREHAPTIIVNCAAYTRVDQAEQEEGVANAVNGSAVQLLAKSTNDTGALLVQISTDFVFDGTKTTPYEVDDAPGPVSAYGRSKLLGEIAASHARKHLIVRTSWLFGRNGPNFVEAMRNQVNRGTNPLRVVNDQRGRPTYTPHLAQAILRLAQNEDARGIVHYADEDACTWYDFARAIVSILGNPVSVQPVTSDEFSRPARRPAYSVLSTDRYERLTGVRPGAWRAGLSEYLRKPE